MCREYNWLFGDTPRMLRYQAEDKKFYRRKFKVTWGVQGITLFPVGNPIPFERKRNKPMTWKDVDNTYTTYHLFGLIGIDRAFCLHIFKTL